MLKYPELDVNDRKVISAPPKSDYVVENLDKNFIWQMINWIFFLRQEIFGVSTESKIRYQNKP